MEGYGKTALLVLSYAQPLALMAMLATISPVSPKIKIAVGICAATTAILLGEKLYNYCVKNNPSKQTSYHFSKSIVGLVGIAATFTSGFKLPAIAWNVGVFTATTAIISPVPYEWLTKSDSEAEATTRFTALTRRVTSSLNNLRNPWPEERVACLTAAILPIALWSAALLIPRVFLLATTYAVSGVLKDGLSFTNEPKLAIFGNNILKSLRMNKYFEYSAEKEKKAR